MKKNLLITGATGYTGFKLAEYLCEKHCLILLLRTSSKNRFRIASIEDRVKVFEYSHYSELPDFFEENKFDCVFHLATTNRNGNWKDTLESNLVFSTHLVKSYVESVEDPCFINTSPYSAYDSEGNFSPNTFYDASKKAFEDLLEFFRLQERLVVMTLNLYDVYGTDDWRGKIFSVLLDSFKSGKLLHLTEGREYLNHLYIGDVVKAYESAMNLVVSEAYRTQNIHKRYNLASGETITLKETVALMEEVLGKKATVEWGVFPYPKGRMIAKPFLGGESLPGWRAESRLRKVLISNPQ